MTSLILPLPHAPASAWVFVLFLKNDACSIHFGFSSSPVNRPCHRSVFLSTHFLPPDVRLPPKELAVSVPGPVHFTSSASADGGGGAGWAGPWGGGASGFSGRGHLCPAFHRTASLYIIYICMYCSRFCTDHALCQVVPIKAAPRALLPGFLIRRRGWGAEMPV